MTGLDGTRLEMNDASVYDGMCGRVRRAFMKTRDVLKVHPSIQAYRKVLSITV